MDPLLQWIIEETAREVQPGQFPIFCITPAKPGDTRMTYREPLKIGSELVIEEWSIGVTASYGWPGEREAALWRAILHIVGQRAGAEEVTKPLQTALEEILDHMPSQGKDDQNWKAITDSLKCLSYTNLEIRYWYTDERKGGATDSFPLIGRLRLSSDVLPDGKHIVKVSIDFGVELFQSLQSRYAKPRGRKRGS